MNKVLLIILCFICFNHLKADSIDKDSLQIVDLFKYALQNPKSGDSINYKAKSIVTKNNNALLLNDTYHYQLAVFLFQTAQLDSAMTIANNGIKINIHGDSITYKSFKFHNILGSVYLYKNEHTKSVHQFQITIKILEKFGNLHQAALIKNNLANVFFSLHDYEASYKYSEEAYLQLKKEKDTIYLPSLTGVFAVSAIELNYINQADSLANESLELSQKHNNILGLIVSNYCLGDINVSQDKFIESENYFLTSLQISKKIGHKSFITLNKVGLMIAYYNLKKYSKAIQFGEEALEETTAQKNENLFYSLHKTLGRSYRGSNLHIQAYTHINKAHNIYKKSATLENKKAINDILIKYDTEKKEKKIAKDKLKIAEDEIKLNKRKQWIIVLSAMLTILLISYLFYYKFQKEKKIQEKKEEEQKRTLALLIGEEKERERISNELHDGVASSITAIKIQLEHVNSINKNDKLGKLVKQLSNLHEDTRRISHNLMPISLSESSLIESIEVYCLENSTANLKIHFSNLIQNNIKFSTSTSTILYRILQELINNINKHANTNVCYVQTFMVENKFALSVEDEGKGFDLLKNKESQGLKSIRNRINNLDGELIIESKLTEGTLTVIKLNI